MNPIDFLKANQAICATHAQRLSQSLEALRPILPFSEEKLANFDLNQLGILEILTSRFAKLQDSISNKIFPTLLVVLEEEIQGKSFIDLLNRLEKIEILPSVTQWQKMREIRNHVTHEYPDNPKLRVEHLNKAIYFIEKLLDFWAELNQKIKSLPFKKSV